MRADRQTDTLVAILRTPPSGEVNNNINQHDNRLSCSLVLQTGFVKCTRNVMLLLLTAVLTTLQQHCFTKHPDIKRILLLDKNNHKAQ